jgi:hypothetical protein
MAQTCETQSPKSKGSHRSSKSPNVSKSPNGSNRSKSMSGPSSVNSVKVDNDGQPPSRSVVTGSKFLGGAKRRTSVLESYWRRDSIDLEVLREIHANNLVKIGTKTDLQTFVPVLSSMVLCTSSVLFHVEAPPGKLTQPTVPMYTGFPADKPFLNLGSWFLAAAAFYYSASTYCLSE